MCSICGTSFSRAFGLKEHISMVHEGNKPFQCSTCDYKCSMKSSLDKHVRCVHEKRKPYNCTICEKSFFTKVAVNRHTLAVHEKQKNFNCHLCNLSFSIKCNLKRHILSVHEKVKVKKSIKKESKLIDQVLIQNWVQFYRNLNLRSKHVPPLIIKSIDLILYIWCVRNFTTHRTWH